MASLKTNVKWFFFAFRVHLPGFFYLLLLFSGFSKRVPPKELPLKTDDDKSDRWSLDRGAWKSNESAVYKKTLRQRIEESHFPKEFKDHIEKEGDLDLDQKTGSVGKFVFSRSKTKQAEVDARKEEQNKTEASPSS